MLSKQFTKASHRKTKSTICAFLLLITLVNCEETETAQPLSNQDNIDEPLGDKPVSELENALSPDDSPSEDTTYAPKDRFILAQEHLFSGREQRQQEAYKILDDLSSKHGLPQAQHAQSFMLVNGIGVEQDLSKGLTLKTFAALGGDEGARLSLGFQYYTGAGVGKDCEKALVYYEQVAAEVIKRYRSDGMTTLSNRHNTDIQKYQIKLYEFNDPSVETAADSSQEEEALDWIKFRQAKAITEPDQLLVIGQYYMNGMFGLPRDYKKAVQSFEKVNANTKDGREHPLALAYIGRIYLEGGDGVERNDEKALEYLQKAIKLGSAVARATLGYAHLKGLAGLEVNEKKAQDLFEASAKSGWFEGAVHLGEMYYEGLVAGGKSLKNYQNALKYFGIASQQRNIIAMYYMGKMHMNGFGASRNCQTATGYFKEVIEMGDKETIQLWKQAFESYKAGDKASALTYYLWLADLGHEIAQVNSAQIIQDEQNVLSAQEVEIAKNEHNGGFVRAKYNLQRAADQSNLCASFATLQLGDYYYLYEQNYDKAISLYRSSGDSHSNPQALFNIGYMYQYGQGLTKDLHLAKRYYDKAVEADQDASIPVFLALTKLFFDFAKMKAETLFTVDNLKSVGDVDVEGKLVHYFGTHWDVIAITFLAFIGAFVMAWRRQNALLYRRMRAAELQRLQEAQRTTETVPNEAGEAPAETSKESNNSSPTAENQEENNNDESSSAAAETQDQ